MRIVEHFAANSPCYQQNVRKADSRYILFQSRGPVGLMLHSVGCAQPDAKVFADRWNRADNEALAHAVLQADGTVYQTLPWSFRCWHAGGSANDTHIGVEMTEPSAIRYIGKGAAFNILDLEEARAQARGTYNTAAELFAKLCDQFGLDPLTDIISHAEGAKRGIASTHADPEHLWQGLGMNYSMDTFRAEVRRRLDALHPPVSPDTPIKDDEEDTTMTKNEILNILGDQWIETFADLPEWAKPEVRELIEIGALKGTRPAETVEAVTIAGTLNNLVRPMIIAFRSVKAVAGDAPKEVLADMLKRVLAGIYAED